jgi:hypothetical protein
LFASSCLGIKTELLYFQKMISKRNQNITNCARVFQRQNKTLDNLKKFWKRNKTKAFGQKILRTDRNRFVLFQNFDFKTFTFDLFWNESSKTEASDLERSLI